jgi:hypothetical protein
VIENSSAGLAMLADEVAVTVTGEQLHQSALARYPVAAGMQRRVAVELGWCTIGAGKYRGLPAVEVRLDDQRVGELTYLMSQRYGPLVGQVASRGGRPGCAAVIHRGAAGLEIVLRLPRETEVGSPAVAPTVVLPGPAAMRSGPAVRRNTFDAHRPAWIAAAVVTGLLVVGVAIGAANGGGTSAKPASEHNTSGAVSSTVRTSEPKSEVPPPPVPATTEPTTTEPTTTAAPAPKPPAPAQPAPRTTTTRVVAPPKPQPQPQPKCDPNYSGCVPVASDVDCLGGSGNGPAYVQGPIQVIGKDIYDLDRDHDGIACE